MECLNRVLDGDDPQSSLIADEHYTTCDSCRQRVNAARVLAAWHPTTPTPSADFAVKVMNAAMASCRQQKVRRQVIGLAALAASLTLGIWFVRPPQTTPHAQPVIVQQSVAKPLADAREAIASLSTKAIDESIVPAANLFAIASEKPKTDMASPLEEVPDAAKAGMQPLVNSPKRALKLFIRDISGVAMSTKSKP